MRRALVLLALFTLPAQAFAQGTRSEESIPRSQESITIERILIDARVTDRDGDPILELTPADFRVKIDGKLAKVESVEWIPETSVARELASVERPQAAATDANVIEEPAPQGRLLVFLFQTDFARNRGRIGGQMKINGYIDEMLETLEPEDRVAVLSYDSHLKFRLDLSNEKSKIREAMRSALLIDDPPPPQMVPMPRLGGRLNRDEMKKVSNPETALIVIANALRPIPGPKSLVLFGWGLGYLLNGRVMMGPDYAAARRALESARVACFSLDFSEADGHDLAVGLATAAADTGGFYASTFRFPQMAMDRLTKTLSGHYELEVRKPDTKIVGAHTIEVDVRAKNAVVMARTSYVDQ
jgi:VWFA-related protein